VSDAPSLLPDLLQLDADVLRALVVQQQAQIVTQHEQLLSKDQQLASRDEEIERLKLLIAKLRRMQFGRKSEKLDWQIEQLELKLDELEASRAQQAAASPVSLAASDVNRVRRRARQALPAHLPRETHRVLPKQEACPDCGGKLQPLGEDISEMLEYVPEHFKVIRQVRPKLACACCDKIAVSRPIERGIAGPGLLAHVLVSNMRIIYRCIGRRRSTPGTAWNASRVLANRKAAIIVMLVKPQTSRHQGGVINRSLMANRSRSEFVFSPNSSMILYLWKAMVLGVT
jgi:Transposase C of IS166 homeodomain/zinc-finger binding domain of transposase IS66